jgi:hypothetical protein
MSQDGRSLLAYPLWDDCSIAVAGLERTLESGIADCSVSVPSARLVADSLKAIVESTVVKDKPGLQLMQHLVHIDLGIPDLPHAAEEGEGKDSREHLVTEETLAYLGELRELLVEVSQVVADSRLHMGAVHLVVEAALLSALAALPMMESSSGNEDRWRSQNCLLAMIVAVRLYLTDPQQFDR